MPYKPTGNPPGRPRRPDASLLIAEIERKDAQAMVDADAVQPEEPDPLDEPAKPLSRAHAGFRRLAADPTEGLHRPPRYRRTETGRRPVLHPNVIKG